MKGKGKRTEMRVSGNPDVFAEADKKKGGRVKRATGGKVPAKKEIGLMTGGAVRARLDRPGRKTGGRVGANTSPLSTAHSGSKGGAGSTPSPKDTYGGTPA